MTLFISSFKKRGFETNGLCLVIFFICFVLLASALYIFNLTNSLRNSMYPFSSLTENPDSEFYLSYENAVLDADVIFHNLWGVEKALRNADVLFVGNSRASYGFKPSALRHVYERLGLTTYMLGFPGGADAFPLAIVKKYDLRPKLMVINGDGFFKNDLTRFGKWAVERSRWESAKFYFEKLGSWVAKKNIHRMFPRYFDYRSFVIYRSNRTGEWRWVSGSNSDNLITSELTPEINLSALQRQIVQRSISQQAEWIEPFINEMTTRGTQIIVTFVPYSDHEEYHATKKLTERFGLPFVPVWSSSLRSMSGSHMRDESAIKWSERLLRALIYDDKFRGRTSCKSLDPKTCEDKVFDDTAKVRN